MVLSTASTVRDYLASLPPDRRAAIARVRDVINDRLPDGYEETMQYGAISWIVPRARLAETYNGQPLAVAALASQKQYMALYLMTVYGDSKLASWFKAAFAARGKKLDMGKACVRFKTLDALPLDVIGDTIAKVSVDAYVAVYEASRSKTVKAKPVGSAKAQAKATTKAKAQATTSTTNARTKAKPMATSRARTAKRTATSAWPAKRTATKRASRAS
jgi:Domain of unknown function (DU1801)